MNNNLFDLSGKIAMVTGGTRGIGLAIALGFKNAGADVWIHGKKSDSTKQIADKHGLHYAYADMRNSDELERMIEIVASGVERLDILVNNAGFEMHQGIQDADEEYLESIYNVNAKAPYFLVQGFLPLLKNSEGASIINVTSIHQQIPVKGNSSYCMAKASLDMFTKVAALEFAPFGIRVNNLAPGAIETNMNRELIREMSFDEWIPMGRVGKVDEMVGPAIFLASAASSYVTGTTLFVDGGYKENLLRY